MTTRNGTETKETDSAQEKRPVVCELCRASGGSSPIYIEAAQALAHALHAKGMKLMYDGGTTGMGGVARVMVSLGRKEAVHGIKPRTMVKAEGALHIPRVTNYECLVTE